MRNLLTPLFGLMQPKSSKTNLFPQVPSLERLEDRVLMSSSVQILKALAKAKSHHDQKNQTTVVLGGKTAPAAPTLSGNVISDSEIDLSWTAASNNPTSYVLQQSSDNGATFKTIATLSGTTLSYKNTMLTVATPYVYQVEAVNGSGPSPWSNQMNLTTLSVAHRIGGINQPGTYSADAPGIPVISAFPTTSNEIDITWSTPSNNPTSYRIERSSDGINYSVLGPDMSSTQLVYDDASASPGTTYFYKVVAFNAAGGSPWSVAASATTPVNALPGSPSAPVISYTIISPTEVIINWPASTNNPSTYLIQRGTTPYFMATLANLSGSTLSYDDTAVVGGQTYLYHVTALNNAGASDWSNTLQFTMPSPVITAKPTTPTNVVASLINGSQVDITWDASLNNPQNYEVQRSTDGRVFSTLPGGTVSGFTTIFHDTTVLGASRYYYRVIASNSAGDSTPGVSNPPFVITPAAGTANTPEIVAYVISSTEIDIAWPAIGIVPTSYRVFRSTDNVNFTALTPDVSGTTYLYQDTNLTPGVMTFYYEVMAIDPAGNSPMSNVAQVTIPTGTGNKPGPTNTGPTNSSILTHVGTLTITTPNTVLTNLYITGTLYIEAPGVIISNFIINATGVSYGIQVINPSGGNNSVTASDGEIFGALQGGIFGRNWTANRLNIHDMGADATDGGGNILLENSWIHLIGLTPGAHADGFQANNGTNMVLQGNFFDLPWRLQIGNNTYKTNSCIFLNEELGNQDPANLYGTVISNNWFDGGNFAIYCNLQSGTVITNNIFGPDYQYGFVYNPVGCPQPAVWVNNVDYNGHTIPVP